MTTYIRENFDQLLKSFKECMKHTHKFHSKNITLLHEDHIKKYLPYGYDNFSEAMAEGIKTHKVSPKPYYTDPKHSVLYNILDGNLIAKQDKCAAKYFGEKPTDKDILDHIHSFSSASFYVTNDEYTLLKNEEDNAFISELNEQFGYKFQSYGDEKIIDQTINDLGLNEEIHHNDI
jgi:hypothetical protein